MRESAYTFDFKGGPITVYAFGYEQAKIKAQAVAIGRGWDYKIIEATDKAIDKCSNLKLIDKALMAIIEMDDTLTCDEQLDCIDALRKLKNKYQHIYKGGHLNDT